MICLLKDYDSTGWAWTNQMYQDNRHCQSPIKSFNTICWHLSSGLWKKFHMGIFCYFCLSYTQLKLRIDFLYFYYDFDLEIFRLLKATNQNLAMSTDPPFKMSKQIYTLDILGFCLVRQRKWTEYWYFGVATGLLIADISCKSFAFKGKHWKVLWELSPKKAVHAISVTTCLQLNKVAKHWTLWQRKVICIWEIN